jgi:hypothetical protein
MKSVKEIMDMYPCIGVTGTRHNYLVPEVCALVRADLVRAAVPVLVGDAPGVDAVFSAVPGAQIFKAKSRKSMHLVQRSSSLVKATAAAGGCLLAFPAARCPVQVLPSRRFEGHGSGSWGTIALAIFYRVPVLVYWPDFAQGMYTPAPFTRVNEGWLLFNPLPALL